MSAAGRGSLGNRLAPPRFLAFLIALPLAFAGWRMAFAASSWMDALAMAFDLAALLFLASLVPLLRDHTAAQMRRDAAANDANRVLVLVVSVLLAMVVLAAISGELAAAKAGVPYAMIKLLGTLTLAWLFANCVFALHYAHSFYTAGKGSEARAGIAFPGTSEPDYGDFAYFAFTLGMTFQTSDVQITAPGLRRVALFHSIAAFVFNLGVIAFTINALGGN